MSQRDADPFCAIGTTTTTRSSEETVHVFTLHCALCHCSSPFYRIRVRSHPVSSPSHLTTVENRHARRTKNSKAVPRRLPKREMNAKRDKTEENCIFSSNEANNAYNTSDRHRRGQQDRYSSSTLKRTSATRYDQTKFYFQEEDERVARGIIIIIIRGLVRPLHRSNILVKRSRERRACRAESHDRIFVVRMRACVYVCVFFSGQKVRIRR